MKRIVRLTESDLTRIVRRVISEAKLPFTGDYLVKETQKGFGSGTIVYKVNSAQSPVGFKDYKGMQAFKITLSATKYYQGQQGWENKGATTITMEHRCGSPANYFPAPWNGGIKETDSGTAAYVSQSGGVLESKSNAFCNSKGESNQSSI
jgi:hypothetical protein